jgi:hypothetical protein
MAISDRQLFIGPMESLLKPPSSFSATPLEGISGVEISDVKGRLGVVVARVLIVRYADDRPQFELEVRVWTKQLERFVDRVRNRPQDR